MIRAAELAWVMAMAVLLIPANWLLGPEIAALVALGGCTPAVQYAFVRPRDFRGPEIGEGTFTSFDGARLGLSTWPAVGGRPRVVIVGLHGMNDYANAFWMAAPWWAERAKARSIMARRERGSASAGGSWFRVQVRV